MFILNNGLHPNFVAQSLNVFKNHVFHNISRLLRKLRNILRKKESDVSKLYALMGAIEIRTG